MEVETTVEESNNPAGRVSILFSTDNTKYICVVDLNSGEISKIQLDRYLGFCVLKNNLYAFDHCDPYMGANHRRAAYRGQSVYKFDIPSSKFMDLNLEKSMMRRVCRMQNKSSPKGYVMPDRKKILIFSSVITLDDLQCNFELFDPELGKCTEKLPNPCFYNQRKRSYSGGVTQIQIVSFAFINPHTLFISDGEDMLSIDLNESEKKRTWEPWRSFSGQGPMAMPLHGFMLLGQDICCLGWNSCFNIVSLEKDTPRSVPGLGGFDDTCFYTFPGLSSLPSSVAGGIAGGGATILGEHGGRATLCIMQAFLEGIDDLNVNGISLSLDVYDCDLLECKKGIKQDLAEKALKIMQKRKKKIKRTVGDPWIDFEPIILPGMTKVKSLVFHLDPPPPAPLKYFCQENFFAMFPSPLQS